MMKGIARPVSKSVPPNLKQIALPIYPQKARKPAMTPLTSLGMFLEKYPSKLTPWNTKDKEYTLQMKYDFKLLGSRINIMQQDINPTDKAAKGMIILGAILSASIPIG